MSKIPEIRADKGDVIGVGVSGDGNVIIKDLSVVINQARGYGLTLIRTNHFKENSDTDSNFEDWKNGFNFTPESIYFKREYRRATVLDEIIKGLEKRQRLLLLGESGTSKSTLLMEVVCYYFDKRYKVLYSEGNEEPRELDHIAEFIRDLIRGGNKVLVAVDNVHDKKMASVFYVIKLLQSFNKRQNVIFLLSARQPEYRSLLEKGKFTLEDNYRHAIESLFVNAPVYNYEINPFSESEIKEFVTKYKEYLPENRKQKSIEENAKEIFEETGGSPIMVKFSVFGKGLREDVEDRYGRYLLVDANREKPDSNRIRTVIICSLFHISTLQMTDELLDKMGLLAYANDLDRAILYLNPDKTWTTLHPRWDEELLAYLFGKNTSKNLIKTRRDDLSSAVQSIFTHCDESSILTLVNTLYATIAFNKFISIDIISGILPVIPDGFSDDFKLKIYTLVIGITHDSLRRHQEAIGWYDKALEIDPNYVDALNNKGVALGNLGKYEEVITCNDKILKIDPNYVDALNNKGVALGNLGKYEEEIHCYDEVLAIDPNNINPLYNKGTALYNLGKYQEGIEWFDKALKVDPNNVTVLNGKGIALDDLGKYQEAIEWYDKALKVDPNNVTVLNGKGIALKNLGKYQEAVEWYDKALKVDPNSFSVLDNKSYALFRLNRLDEGIQCSSKATEINPSGANAWYNRSSYLIKKGEMNEALENLQEAIRLDKTYIESAKTDKDFDSIRNDAKFKELIGLR